MLRIIKINANRSNNILRDFEIFVIIKWEKYSKKYKE